MTMKYQYIILTLYYFSSDRGMFPMLRGIFVAALLDEFLVDIDGGWRTAILLQVDGLWLRRRGLRAWA